MGGIFIPRDQQIVELGRGRVEFEFRGEFYKLLHVILVGPKNSVELGGCRFRVVTD